MEEQFRSFRTLSTKTDIKLSSSEFVVLFHKTLERLQPIKLRIEYKQSFCGILVGKCSFKSMMPDMATIVDTL